MEDQNVVLLSKCPTHLGLTEVYYIYSWLDSYILLGF